MKFWVNVLLKLCANYSKYETYYFFLDKIHSVYKLLKENERRSFFFSKEKNLKESLKKKRMQFTFDKLFCSFIF